MERKLLIEVLKLLRTMGTLKMLDTDKVTTMITTIENHLNGVITGTDTDRIWNNK